MLRNPNQEWNNNYLIYLQSDDLDELIEELEIKSIDYTKFNEPDLDGEITAIACCEKCKSFKRLNLI